MTQFSFRTMLQNMFAGREDCNLPFFGKHVLRDIGLIEPACDNVEGAQHRHSQHRALEIGLTGSMRV